MLCPLLLPLQNGWQGDQSGSEDEGGAFAGEGYGGQQGEGEVWEDEGGGEGRQALHLPQISQQLPDSSGYEDAQGRGRGGRGGGSGGRGRVPAPAVPNARGGHVTEVVRGGGGGGNGRPAARNGPRSRKRTDEEEGGSGRALGGHLGSGFMHGGGQMTNGHSGLPERSKRRRKGDDEPPGSYGGGMQQGNAPLTPRAVSSMLKAEVQRMEAVSKGGLFLCLCPCPCEPPLCEGLDSLGLKARGMSGM